MIITYLTRTHDGRPAGTVVDNSGVSSWLNDLIPPDRIVDPAHPGYPEDADDELCAEIDRAHQQALAEADAERRGAEATIERVVTANLGEVPRDAVDYVHVTDPELQQQCLTHRHHVERGEVKIGEPNPPPEPPEPSERDKAAERIKAAKRMADVDLDDLKLVLGVGE